MVIRVNIKLSSHLKSKNGNVMIVAVLLISVVGILFNSMVSLILGGQKTIQQSRYQVDVDNVIDLAQNLVTSPNVCSIAFNGLALVAPVDPNNVATSVGALIPQIPYSSGTPALVVNGTYQHVILTRLELFDLGAFAPGSPSHQVALLLELKNKNQASITVYHKVVYFYLIGNAGLVVGCGISSTFGGVNAIFVSPTVGGSGGATGNQLTVLYGLGASLNPAVLPSPQGFWTFSWGAGTILTNGCAPPLVAADARGHTYSFQAPTGAVVAFTQGVDPIYNINNGCVTTAGPLNWTGVGFNGWPPP